jgi:hypothetical protein
VTSGMFTTNATVAVGADSVLTYDDRLAESAAAAGIAVLAPS